MSCQNLCACCQKLRYGSPSVPRRHCVSASHLGLRCKGNHSSLNRRIVPLAQSTMAKHHSVLLTSNSNSFWNDWCESWKPENKHYFIKNPVQHNYFLRVWLLSARFILEHRLPYHSMQGLFSSVMCLLKWTWVIELDNLKTQGLGLLLATIFSEETHFSHCLLSLFLRANT